MTTFRDNRGQEWGIAIDLEAVRRVREASAGEWDLLDFDSVFTRTNGNEPEHWAEFWELLFLVIEPQAIQAGDSAQDFAEVMVTPRGLLLAPIRSVFYSAWATFLDDRHPDQALVLRKHIAWQQQALKQHRRTEKRLKRLKRQR